jgi:hypothetical protein
MMINFKDNGLIFTLETDDTWTYEDFNRIITAIWPSSSPAEKIVEKMDKATRDVCDPDLSEDEEDDVADAA